MYTSNKRKTALLYLAAALSAALFGGIYEQFSHGVYSSFMIYAFLFPLAGGAMPCLLAGERVHSPPPAAGNLWGAGIAALTVGALFRGALDIYGTSSPLTNVYWIGGGLLLAAAVLVRLTGRTAGRRVTAPKRSRLPERTRENGYESAHRA